MTNGVILTPNDSGLAIGSDRFIFVEDAEVKFHAILNGANEMIVAAFPTDGFRQLPGGMVPGRQYLAMAYTFGPELDVPQHVVDFAVVSWKQRHSEIDDMSSLFEDMWTDAPKLSEIDPVDVAEGFGDFLRLLQQQEQEGPSVAEEHAIGLEIAALMQAALK